VQSEQQVFTACKAFFERKSAFFVECLCPAVQFMPADALHALLQAQGSAAMARPEKHAGMPGL